MRSECLLTVSDGSPPSDRLPSPITSGRRTYMTLKTLAWTLITAVAAASADARGLEKVFLV
jgi:hypothetical protein